MNELHIRGPRCNVCCCHKQIHENCGGYWHSRVVEDDPEEGWIHNYKCDKCNEENYNGYEDCPIEFKD